ncbi:hypothetical protein NHX12_020683 [Muraenolepis orangiensis]|uniref:Splicing factor 45 n=1 Tax=Muraenolepis orangiensis TaxID=630683 RepID=A0A9Q0EXJ5_9TELE|nr:hypothetical protein NHX12_020683 [Muraenolepis orangiensis]
MSLYDDLTGVAANDTKTEGWSKNFKLLQSQLKVKKAALTQAKTQRMKQTTVLAPVIDLKRGGPVDERQVLDTPPHIAISIKDAVPTAFSPGDVLVPLADEYDPMFPNDYEKVRKDRHEVGAPTGFSRFPAAEGDSDDEDDYEKERRKRAMGGAAIAPPSSLVDRDGPAPSFSYEDEGRPPRGKAAIPPPMGTVAHKIMQKYGFREGQGLGKHEQGLSTALSVEKTTDPSKKSDANPLTEILKFPTKVVILRNMVGRGEVDEDLEGETKEECEKYGKVTKCVIFEIPLVMEEEAVRIFLEFERVESAIKGQHGHMYICLPEEKGTYSTVHPGYVVLLRRIQ